MTPRCRRRANYVQRVQFPCWVQLLALRVKQECFHQNLERLFVRAVTQGSTKNLLGALRATIVPQDIINHQKGKGNFISLCANQNRCVFKKKIYNHSGIA